MIHPGSLYAAHKLWENLTELSILTMVITMVMESVQ